MRSAIVLFTRDLRVHDNAALRVASEQAERVLPLFVLDDAVLLRFGAPSRVAFLLDALRDLDESLRARGGHLVVRRGDTVAEVMRLALDVGAEAVFLAEDVSAFARSRARRLRHAAAAGRIAVHELPGVTVVPPGDVVPTSGGDAFSVFTPYWNRWRAAPRRAILAPPLTLSPPAADPARLPSLAELVDAHAVRGLPGGGESEGRRRLEHWLREGLVSYGDRRDDVAVDGTSGLSPYLHFGCLSPSEIEQRAAGLPGGVAFVRQLCWRDFHHQLLGARPSIAVEDLRPRGDAWRRDHDALTAWQEGQTGYPLVDAGMRQLTAVGTMHNRVRLVTASFLTKHLYLDWRTGADHFAAHLVDGDLANNVGNWQWVAGTGADTRPNRVFNPIRQAHRYDPDGTYVRRWVPELQGIEGGAVHQPWRADHRRPTGYPDPIVDHDEAVERFRRARAA